MNKSAEKNVVPQIIEEVNVHVTYCISDIIFFEYSKNPLYQMTLKYILIICNTINTYVIYMSVYINTHNFLRSPLR